MYNLTSGMCVTFSYYTHIWNKLPENWRSAHTLISFKSRLKTFLFATAFHWSDFKALNYTVTDFFETCLCQTCSILAYVLISLLVLMFYFLMSSCLSLISLQLWQYFPKSDHTANTHQRSFRPVSCFTKWWYVFLLECLLIKLFST